MKPKNFRDTLSSLAGGQEGRLAARVDDAGVKVLPLDRLTPCQAQPRRQFNDQTLQELADSIRIHGVLTPLLVRPSGDTYEIVAGERRFRAARLAGLREVPVTLRELSDQKVREIALIENIQREDLNPFDRALAKLDLLANAWGLSPEETRSLLHRLRKNPATDPERVAEADALFSRLGRESWRSFSSNGLRVIDLPALLLQAAQQGELPYSHATLIAGVAPIHHAELLELARSGATLEDLRVAIAGLKATPEPAARYLGVRKLLTPKRIKVLSPAQREELDRLLASVEALLQ